MTDYSQIFYVKSAESYSPNFGLDSVKKNKQKKTFRPCISSYFINHNLILLNKSLFYIDIFWEGTLRSSCKRSVFVQ